MTHQTYNDGHGRLYNAVHLTWTEVEEILGEPHTGDPEQDDALVRHLLLHESAPEWVEDADEGWVDEEGWGLIGPRIG